MELSKRVDNLFIYDPEGEDQASKFADDVKGDSAKHSVKTMDDLTAALNNYSGVKFLEIFLHGSPGMLYLADKTIVVGSYLNKMSTNHLFLQKDACILFDGCSIGAGEAGDKFMDSIGAGLLAGKGGTVGATTVSNVDFKLITRIYMNPFSLGRLKVKRYGIDGKLIASQAVNRWGNKVF